jgi:type II secretory pathway component PulF
MSALAAKTAEELSPANEGAESLSAGARREKAQDMSQVFGGAEMGAPSDVRGPDSVTLPQTGAVHLGAVKVKQPELILFTTQLSVMLDSGVVLSDALDAIGGQAEREGFKAIIMSLAEAVKSGESFSKALAAHPRIFNPMFISMVKASEASGKMSEMLDVLSGYLSFEC